MKTKTQKKLENVKKKRKRKKKKTVKRKKKNEVAKERICIGGTINKPADYKQLFYIYKENT